MKYFIFCIIALFLAALAGCSTAQSIDVSKRSRTFDKDFTTVFRAAITYLTNEGYPIAQTDKDLGILNTDWLENSGFLKAMGSNQRIKLNMVIQPVNQGTTRIVASMSWQHQPGGNKWTEAMVSEGQAADRYKDIFDGISKLLE